MYIRSATLAALGALLLSTTAVQADGLLGGVTDTVSNLTGGSSGHKGSPPPKPNHPPSGGHSSGPLQILSNNLNHNEILSDNEILSGNEIEILSGNECIGVANCIEVTKGVSGQDPHNPIPPYPHPDKPWGPRGQPGWQLAGSGGGGGTIPPLTCDEWLAWQNDQVQVADLMHYCHDKFFKQ